jgi:hypothetical protein
MAGRNTKLTPQLQQQLCNVIGSGNYIQTACDYVGIGYPTFWEWMERGLGTHSSRPKTRLYAEFADAVRKAEAQAEAARVARIAKAGQEGVWQADAWYLERRYPERWGRRYQEVKHSGGIATEPNFEGLTRAQLARIAAGEDPVTVLAETAKESK